MQLEQLDSISKISSVEWDRLAGDDALYSHAWLSTVEASALERANFLYLLARHEGTLVGAAACQVRIGHEAASLNKAFYGRASGLARATGLGAAPAIVVGSRYGFSPPFVFDRSLASHQCEEIAETLIGRVVEHAERIKASVLLRNTKPGMFARTLSQAHFVGTPDVPTTYIDIRWRDFAEFRRDLRKIHPATEKAIRNQASRAKRHGIVVERLSDPKMLSDELFHVLDSHHRRLNGLSLPFSGSFLTEAFRRLCDSADLTIARDASGILGVQFALRKNGVSHALLVGTATERARTANAYYLLLNHVMNRAIESQDRRIYFGRLLYDVKLRRGCSIERSTIWIRGRSRLQRAGLRRVVPIRSMKIERMIRALEAGSRSNAIALQGS
jgi:predicted N-acyltransferase